MLRVTDRATDLQGYISFRNRVIGYPLFLPACCHSLRLSHIPSILLYTSGSSNIYLFFCKGALHRCRRVVMGVECSKRDVWQRHRVWHGPFHSASLSISARVCAYAFDSFSLPSAHAVTVSFVYGQNFFVGVGFSSDSLSLCLF